MKQDRNGVRSAQDLERKYDFSSLSTLKKAVELSTEGINKTNAELENFMKATLDNFDNMQSQIDGNITTYYYSGVPTLSNLPVSDWEVESYNTHLGDLYYDKETGYAYRFYLDSITSIYGWTKLTDIDVTEALALANAAKDTADSKRRVFTIQPTPPYDNGDLWLNNEEIYKCQISKASGNYADGDFIIATKYTDDTLATQVGNELTVVKGQVTKVKEKADGLEITVTENTNLVNELSGQVETLNTKQTEFEQTQEGFSTRVSEVETTNSDLSESIINVNNDLATTQTQLSGAITNITELSTEINQTKESIILESERITTIEENGVKKLVTEENFVTIDINGINVAVNKNAFNAQIINTGFICRDGLSIIAQITTIGSLLVNLEVKGKLNLFKVIIKQELVHPTFGKGVASYYIGGV